MSNTQSIAKGCYLVKVKSFFSLALLAFWLIPAFGSDLVVKDLALSGLGAVAHSWEPGVTVVPEHEPAKANDGSLHTYWAVRADDLPADIGIEWPRPQQVSSVIVRYFDGRMVRGPVMARTQQWARLQYWDNGDWKDLDAQIQGQETSSVRYSFSPITTTRVRLLFTEPPDPEFRRSPDRLGIYVCELEAYSEVPFNVINGSQRLVPIHRTEKNYNQWSSEPIGDLAGPLVYEPQQTRVFTDTLKPTLIVSESRWAKTRCSIARAGGGTYDLRNGFLELEVSTNKDLKETHVTNLVTGESVPTPHSLAFQIRTTSDELTPTDFTLVRADTSGSDADVCRLRVDLTSKNLDLALYYELRRQDHFYHKWVVLTNKSSSEIRVLDVSVSSLRLPRPLDMMAGPELTYPIIRLKNGGFFECLETVYWDHQGDTLTYYPGITVPPGKAFETKKAVVGVYRNEGETLGGFDRGVRDWVIEYHAHVSPIPKGWPDIYIEGWSARVGMQQLLEHPEWTEHFFATSHDMGVRYMDAWDATDLALLMPDALQKRWVDLANKYDIGTGWWIDFGSSEGWGFVAPYYDPYLCKLSPDAEKYFQDTVQLVGRYKLRGFHWADFWDVWPCNQSYNGNLPGKYSIYAQGQRMIRFNEEMHEASPGLILGADSGLNNPQYGRYTDSRHHGGGWDAQPSVEPDIHLDRLYGEMNRDYLYGLAHMMLLRPWFRLLNIVNHYGQATHHHDSAGYRFSLLSAIAMAPQLTFNDAPDDIPESDIRFTQHWEEWAKNNESYLKEGDRLFDRTLNFDIDWLGGEEWQAISGFSHIRSDRGYVFLMNPGVVEQIAELSLALNGPPNQRLVVTDVYPGGITLEGPVNGEYEEGGKLTVTVPPKQVRILWIAPAASSQHLTNLQPEDARAAEWQHYIGNWALGEHTGDNATLSAKFKYPISGEPLLTKSVPESAWAKEPWDYHQAYLVLLLKDETKSMYDNWVPDDLPIKVLINGVIKTVHPFETVRRQPKGLTRCYFIHLGTETKSGPDNEVEITLPIQKGLVFSGAYLDLPDQVPNGKPNKPLGTPN
jgi:hypothetical protein